MRELWLKIHRWLGLGIGLFFLIASLTGAILVYENELDAWINGGAWRVTPGDVGFERVLAAVATVSPGEVRELRFPRPREPVYTAAVVSPDNRRTQVRIDPGSGEVAEQVRALNGVVGLIRITHTSLASGARGRTVVVTASWLALISMVTGVILWWPGIRGMLRSLVVRLRRGFYAFNYDLHQVSGILALPLLLLMTLTGVLIPYAGPTERVLRVFMGEGAGERTWEPVVLSGGGDVRATTLQLLQAAVQAVPDARPTTLRAPGRLDRPAVLEMLRGDDYGPGSYIRVMLDPQDASVVQLRDPRRLTRAARLAGPTSGDLHVGAIGGPVVRVLYVIACLVGAGLVIGGFLIWLLKRRLVDAASQRRGGTRRVAAR